MQPVRACGWHVASMGPGLAMLGMLAFFLFYFFPKQPTFLHTSPSGGDLREEASVENSVLLVHTLPARWLCKFCGVGEELSFLRGVVWSLL